MPLSITSKCLLNTFKNKTMHFRLSHKAEHQLWKKTHCNINLMENWFCLVYSLIKMTTNWRVHWSNSTASFTLQWTNCPPEYRCVYEVSPLCLNKTVNFSEQGPYLNKASGQTNANIPPKDFCWSGISEMMCFIDFQ